MQYHIYFDQKSFWITDNISEIISSHQFDLQISNPTEEVLHQAIVTIENENINNVVVITNNIQETWERFKKQFLLIQAGGGLVKNTNDEYLFIFRRGKWDLPKGKLDEGETIEECAVREVNEETGLQNITLHQHLCNTYHTYKEKKKNILKESVWFHMSCPSNQILKPQTEEDIVDIKWLKKDSWSLVKNNIFSSIQDVLNATK